MAEIFENLDILKNPIGSVDDEIIDLKNEVADLYIEKIKEKKGSSLSNFIIGDGDMIKDYLVSEGLLDKISDNFSGNFINKLLDGLDPETSKYFQEAKKELDSANTKDALNQLKEKILNPDISVEDPEAIDDTSTDDASTETSNTDSKETPIVPFVPIYTPYKNLKVGGEVKKEDLEYVGENSKYIVDKLETKGNLTKIKKLKDKNGKIILECRGKTPYVNSKIASDLIGLALIFYNKTGSKFLIESGYRTIEHQEDLKEKNKKTGTPTADPGYSGHNLGYSIDVSTNSRYSKKIGGVSGLKKIAKIFNFHPISSEDWHFDHKEFVDNYYKNKDARLDIAQNLDESYVDNRSMAA
ncbi:D-alanyl-D-alanine carboxypeptidase family protein [Candidatus Gracilibacteria bacterium]|nr:D-alanyl-D-alanine carboxypeptidase family protein [Candidatus Gracilibacteria bacterium]